MKIYTKYMGGVDRSDRMVRTYSVSRKSKKWWYRLFYYLLDTALANSFILYKISPNHEELSLSLIIWNNLLLHLLGQNQGMKKLNLVHKRRKQK